MEKKKVKKRIGRRTGVDAVANKKIKVDDQGNETFEDYFTPSDSSSDFSHLPLNSNLPMNSSPINSNVPRMSIFLKNRKSISKENVSRINSSPKPTSKGYQLRGTAHDFIENAINETPVLNKSQGHSTFSKGKKSYARCRRTANSILAGKKIRITDGEANFDDFWTETPVIDTQSVYSNEPINASTMSLANNTRDGNCSQSPTVSSSVLNPKVVKNKQIDKRYKSNSSISIFRENTRNNSPKKDNQNQEKRITENVSLPLIYEIKAFERPHVNSSNPLKSVSMNNQQYVPDNFSNANKNSLERKGSKSPLEHSLLNQEEENMNDVTLPLSNGGTFILHPVSHPTFTKSDVNLSSEAINLSQEGRNKEQAPSIAHEKNKILNSVTHQITSTKSANIGNESSSSVPNIVPVSSPIRERIFMVHTSPRYSFRNDEVHKETTIVSPSTRHKTFTKSTNISNQSPSSISNVVPGSSSKRKTTPRYSLENVEVIRDTPSELIHNETGVPNLFIPLETPTKLTKKNQPSISLSTHVSDNVASTPITMPKRFHSPRLFHPSKSAKKLAPLATNEESLLGISYPQNNQRSLRFDTSRNFTLINKEEQKERLSNNKISSSARSRKELSVRESPVQRNNLLATRLSKNQTLEDNKHGSISKSPSRSHTRNRKKSSNASNTKTNISVAQNYLNQDESSSDNEMSSPTRSSKEPSVHETPVIRNNPYPTRFSESQTVPDNKHDSTSKSPSRSVTKNRKNSGNASNTKTNMSVAHNYSNQHENSSDNKMSSPTQSRKELSIHESSVIRNNAYTTSFSENQTLPDNRYDSTSKSPSRSSTKNRKKSVNASNTKTNMSVAQDYLDQDKSSSNNEMISSTRSSKELSVHETPVTRNNPYPTRFSENPTVSDNRHDSTSKSPSRSITKKRKNSGNASNTKTNMSVAHNYSNQDERSSGNKILSPTKSRKELSVHESPVTRNNSYKTHFSKNITMHDNIHNSTLKSLSQSGNKNRTNSINESSIKTNVSVTFQTNLNQDVRSSDNVRSNIGKSVKELSVLETSIQKEKARSRRLSVNQTLPNNTNDSNLKSSSKSGTKKRKKYSGSIKVINMSTELQNNLIQHERGCDNQIPNPAKNRKELSSLESPVRREKNAQQTYGENQPIPDKTVNSSKVDNTKVATKSAQSQQDLLNVFNNAEEMSDIEGRNKSSSSVLNSTNPVSRNIKQRSRHAKSASSPARVMRKEDSQLRRSTRNRIPPLQTWRNEHRFFHWKNGELVDIVYEKGNPEDTTSVDVINRRLKYYTASYEKRQKESKLKDNKDNLNQIRYAIDKIPVINPNTGDEEHVYLHRPYKTLLWTVPPSQNPDNPSFTLTKCISSKQVSFGYIDIGARKKKEEQYSPVDNITFNVIHGRVKICINKVTLHLKEKDTVTVPAGNTYSMYNYGRIKALLYFCTFKSPLFDYQLSDNSQDED